MAIIVDNGSATDSRRPSRSVSRETSPVSEPVSESMGSEVLELAFGIRPSVRAALKSSMPQLMTDHGLANEIDSPIGSPSGDGRDNGSFDDFVVVPGFFKQLLNFIIMVITPLPSFYCAYMIQFRPPILKSGFWTPLKSGPFACANILFFLNIDVWFWLLSILQKSTWLIDPYWTFIPLLVAHLYRAHPLAHYDPIRSKVALTLLWIWSLRLTFSYFRREKWRFGWREDWRFTEYRKSLGFFWYPASFFIAYISQHLMLMGLTLPLLAVHNSKVPYSGVWDTFAAAICLCGIRIASVADAQLHRFMEANARRQVTIVVLRTGVWRFSRHPNHFGEQLFWVGVGIFAINCGWPKCAMGFLFNHLCDRFVTLGMIENRMLSKPRRAAAYRVYQTQVWFLFSLRKRISFLVINYLKTEN